MNKTQIPKIDWTDNEYVSQYLGVYGEEFDAVVPQQLERIGDLAGMTFVDLGCGQGTLLIKAAALAERCIGVDVSPRMCELVKGKADAAGQPNVSVVCCDFLNWETSPGSVDVVWSRAAIHHLPDSDKEALFRTIYRALRSGGRFLMEDLMFEFGYSEYESQLPSVAKVLLEHIGKSDKKTILERDILSTLYKEYPSPAGVLRVLLESSGFQGVSVIQHTPFFGEIEATKRIG